MKRASMLLACGVVLPLLLASCAGGSSSGGAGGGAGSGAYEYEKDAITLHYSFSQLLGPLFQHGQAIVYGQQSLL